MTSWSLLGSWVLLIAACAYNPHTDHHSLPDSGGATLHATQNDQLRDLMVAMNSLLFERIHTELEADLGREMAAREIAVAASKLRSNVNAITETLPKLNLPADQQPVFLALAAELGQRAQAIVDVANNRQYARLSPALDNLEQTCMACHHLFRAAHH